MRINRILKSTLHKNTSNNNLDFNNYEVLREELKLTQEHIQNLQALSEDIKTHKHRLNYPSLIHVHDVLNYEISLECFTSDFSNLVESDHKSRYSIESYCSSSSLIDIAQLLLDNKVNLYNQTKKAIDDKLSMIKSKIEKYHIEEHIEILKQYQEIIKSYQ